MYECIEKRASDLSWAVDPVGKSSAMRMIVEAAVSVDKWCGARQWSTTAKTHVRRTRHVSGLVKQEFAQLAFTWKQETAFLSSDTEIVLHPAYQRIIGMGEKVLPLILTNLRDQGGNWYWALRHITGENPIKRDDVGRTVKMKEAWLEWGRDRHYI